jgi:hypothetical protein
LLNVARIEKGQVSSDSCPLFSISMTE